MSDPTAAAAPRPRILIADDSDVCRTVLAILLKNTGFEVTSVVNGREALAKLRDQRFDLAVLDNDMPELDGLGTLVALRGFAPELPVAIVSGTLSKDLRASYEKHGIEAIYDKPVDPRKLRDQIPAILERRKRQAREAAGGISGVSAAPFMVLGAADAALEKPVFAGGSAQVRKLVGDFGRIRDFRSAATISGGAGAAFLDVAVALAEEKDAVLLACAAADVGAAQLTKLFAPALLHTRPVLLIVLNSEALSASQQDLLEDFMGGGGELSAFNGRAKVILCAEASLAELADAGEFNEMLLMRAGAMKLVIPKLAQRREDLVQIARAVLRRIGAPAVKFTPEAVAWLESGAWAGDYLQLHRTVDIARRARPEAAELDVGDLEQALTAEAGWNQPLYHDVLLSTLSGK
ncbi:MAG: response regulator [Burkholderiales bacterium]|nr:response regulator [Opitutaceae bacterium]